MDNNPFFSVCTEVSNRAKTIERTIKSVGAQKFKNFEYIIVNNNSSDESEREIIKTLDSLPELKQSTKYINLDKTLTEICSWNKPLLYSKGKYIVVCEGDDWFEHDHLEKAANVLNTYNNIGLYVSCKTNIKSDYHKIALDGYTSGKLLFEKLINFDFCPPPSEMIFIRGINGKYFNYDEDNYVYAAEYGLYYNILRNGLDGYVNLDSTTVNRGVSNISKLGRKKYFFIKDAYYSFNKWQLHYSDHNHSKMIRSKLFKNCIRKIFIPQLVNFKVEKKFIMHLLAESKHINILNSLIIIFNALFHELIHKISLNIKKIGKLILGQENYLKLQKQLKK